MKHLQKKNFFDEYSVFYLSLFLINVEERLITHSIYSSILTSNSPTYMHPNSYGTNYYDALQMNVTETGTYAIFSKSTINLYGFLYNNTFIPYDPTANLIIGNNDGCSYEQFLLTLILHAHMTYELVITTWDPIVIGSFSITISGPNDVFLNRISKYSSYFL